MGIRGSFKPIGYGQAQSGAGKEVEREFRVSPDLDPTHPVLTGPLSGNSICRKMLLYVFFTDWCGLGRGPRRASQDDGLVGFDPLAR